MFQKERTKYDYHTYTKDKIQTVKKLNMRCSLSQIIFYSIYMYLSLKLSAISIYNI